MRQGAIIPCPPIRAPPVVRPWLTIPASTLMHNSVCPRPVTANRQVFSFGANTYGVGPPPSVGAGIEPASASGTATITRIV